MNGDLSQAERAGGRTSKQAGAEASPAMTRASRLAGWVQGSASSKSRGRGSPSVEQQLTTVPVGADDLQGAQAFDLNLQSHLMAQASQLHDPPVATLVAA